MVLVSLDRQLAIQTIDSAAVFALRGSDAVTVAVALRFASPLVTLDREQHDRAAYALTAYYPEEML
jgi:predicted nucleic acid-binding protein